MHVSAINRYPVKSLQGESLDLVDVDTDGLDGDREWGIVENATGKVWSAKRHGALLGGSARTTPEGPVITLPDGTRLDPHDPSRDAKLSDWLDADVSLRRASSAEVRSYEASLQLDPDVDVFDMPMTAGRFLDLSPVHLLTTASLGAAAAIHPDGDWTADRFRPSIVVELDDESNSSFVENEWIGRTIEVGPVVLDVVLPTVRCVMTTRVQAPKHIERDLEIFKTLRDRNEQNLGVYANVSAPGTIRHGDHVALL